MRLTPITPAPPRSGRPKAVIQLSRLPRRRQLTPRRHSRIYQRLPRQRQAVEVTEEPVLMHLHEGQRAKAVL